MVELSAVLVLVDAGWRKRLIIRTGKVLSGVFFAVMTLVSFTGFGDVKRGVLITAIYLTR